MWRNHAMVLEADTVVAVATPPGIGGVGIVRVSGPRAANIAAEVIGSLPAPRHATFCAFHAADGSVIDQGLALYFPAPHSFTGESVLELHGHGGPVVLDILQRRLMALGARPARAGEFSERAFLNGKLDLAQAEAVADLIGAASDEAARAALNSLQGAFSVRVHAVVDALIRLRTHVEATIDFPEDELDLLGDRALASQTDAITAQLDELLQDARQGQLLHDGMTVVLVGRTNAGKSSLLNLLAQQDSAIVSPVPGTTRDILRERIQIDGLPLHVLDTAGLRDTHDAIESEGVRRAHDAMRAADRILLVIDDAAEAEEGIRDLLRAIPPGARTTLIRNKIDLSGRPPGIAAAGRFQMPELALSATTHQGIAELRQHLKTSMGYQVAGEGSFIARRRHLEALQRARRHVLDGRAEISARRAELAAESLRLGQQALGEITGEFTSDDLLGRIFSSFCIGK